MLKFFAEKRKKCRFTTSKASTQLLPKGGRIFIFIYKRKNRGLDADLFTQYIHKNCIIPRAKREREKKYRKERIATALRVTWAD